jgi:hypothetical protein
MFIYLNDFYQDVEKIFVSIDTLDYTSLSQGLEVPNFLMVPDGIDKQFSSLVGQKINLSENSGVFRKPYTVIHFENFNKNTIFVGAIALCPTKFCTYKHKETNSFSVYSIENNLPEFVNNNCFDKTKWETIADISMNPGSLILFKPWLWHSFDQKLMNFFYLEVNECENVAIVEPVVKDGSLETPTA